MLFKDKYPEETLQIRNPPPSQGGPGWVAEGGSVQISVRVK